MTDDPVRAYMRRREFPDHMINGGLEYLVERWSRTAEAVECHSAWIPEEWDNDLDCRQILEDVLNDVPESERLRTHVKGADSRFLANVLRTEKCVWGDETAAREGWTNSRNWWYWTLPPTPFVSNLLVTPFVIYGTFMRGQSGHANLDNATFLEEVLTAPRYQLFYVDHRWPALIPADDGAEIACELYELSEEHIARLAEIEPREWQRSPVELADGRSAEAFLGDPVLRGRGIDVSAHGGWAAFTRR